jgi:serine/threonine-protein kinase
VAGYRIERVLATGATGTVYLAKNPNLPRRDALKVLSADLSQDTQFRERFVREADIASLLDHPNIVSIYNRDEAENGQLWIAMQYVAGTDAEAALLAGTMTPMRAIRIVGEVAKALDYAHQRNVVHHDVKPANVLLSAESDDGEHALLGDFGVARAIGSEQSGDDSTLTATLAYAAPEVIADGHVDGRADVYSLGCTLFRLLTGRQPFSEAQGTTAVARAHLHQAPPRISDYISGTAPQLDWVMAKVLAKDPAQRFNSARDFARATGEAVNRPTAAVSHREARRYPAGTPAQRSAGLSAAAPPAERTRPHAENAWPTSGVARSHDVNRMGRVTITHTPPRRLVSKQVVVIGAAAAAVIALGLAWLLWPSPDAPTATSPGPTTTAATPSTTAAQDRLTRLLPAGYPPGACKPTRTPDGATAAATCGPNTDPDGPTSATYTLAGDATALRAALNDTVEGSTAVICPPNVQSPGPWQRNDSPTVPRGTLFCGIRADRPLVAWTNDADLLLSVVRGDAPTATLEGLYRWWSSHS